MKTLTELINEINSSGELQEELKAVSVEELDKFLKKHDCDADAKEFAEYVKTQAEGEMEDGAVETVTGGMPGGAYMTPERPKQKPQGVL